MQAGSFLLSNCCHNELYITQKTQYIVFFLFQNVYMMRFYWSMGFIVGNTPPVSSSGFITA